MLATKCMQKILAPINQHQLKSILMKLYILQVQGGLNVTTRNLISIDSELQVEVVIEAPPCSSHHHTHTHYTMANFLAKHTIWW
jgi:hypothetical protein